MTFQKTLKKRIIHILLIAFIVSVFFFLFGIGKIEYSSMSPDYQEGDFILYEKLSSSYEVGDVVVIDYHGKYLLRRVIATSGSQVDINNEEGKIYVDNIEYKGKDGELTVSAPEGIKFPVKVSKKHVFVLSDQRDNIYDSRRLGCISQSDIVGKIIWKM